MPVAAVAFVDGAKERLACSGEMRSRAREEARRQSREPRVVTVAEEPYSAIK